MIGARLVAALAANDVADLYADDAVLYTPLGRFDGRDRIAAEIAELHAGFPGLRVALHDEFESGSRACLRVRLAWTNGGSFRGRPPTNRSGTAAETHVLTLRDGAIAQEIVGVSTFDIAQLYLVDLGLDFPRDIPDPAPEIPADGSTLARRFVRAFDARDIDAFDELFTEDTEIYTPLGWPVAGLAAVKTFVDEFHASNPGLRVALHDEFASADGTRVCWRIRLHFHNTAPFFGNPPTGEAGAMSETHCITLGEGRIARLVVGDNAFTMPHQELVTWRMEFPAGTEDPDPARFRDP